MKPNDIMPVPCTAWAEKLAAQPGDLTTEEHAALDNHILTCPACAAVQAAYSAMDASIMALPPVTPLAELPSELQHILQEQFDAEQGVIGISQGKISTTSFPGARQSTPPASRKSPQKWLRLASAIAAVLVVGALIAGFLVVIGAHQTLISGQNAASTLYVASAGSDGTVYAVRPSDGAVIWQKRLNDRLTGNLLVVKNTLFAVSIPGRVYALRKSDGALLWSSQITQGSTPLSAAIHGTTVTDGQNLYLSSRNTLYAVDTHNGKVLWTRTSSGCSCTTSLVAATGGVAYVFIDGLYALRASDGKVLWHHPEILPAPLMLNELIVTDGKVYVPLAQGRSVFVIVLRLSDGRLLHTLPLHNNNLVNYSSIEVAFANGVLYINSAGHDLYAIRTSDDTTLWHKGFGDSWLFGLSTANDGTLYFAATTVASSSLVDTSQHVTPTPTISTSAPSSDIYALNASDGSQRWHLQPTNNDGYTSGVLAMGENAYLSIGGHLYALSGKDGGQLWMALNATTLGTPVAG